MTSAIESFPGAIALEFKLNLSFFFFRELSKSNKKHKEILHELLKLQKHNPYDKQKIWIKVAS